MDNSWIVQWMEEYGYWGIFLMIALENLFPPIPSEVVLSFGGFMTIRSDLTVVGVVVAATLGSLVGAYALFAIGRLFSLERLEQWVERYGYWMRFRKEDIGKADRWFQRYGIWAVLLGRMVPIVRSLISIPAGMAKMNLGLFTLFTVIGSLIWNAVLVTVGATLGTQWTKILSVMTVYQDVVLVLALLVLLIGIWYVARKRSI